MSANIEPQEYVCFASIVETHATFDSVVFLITDDAPEENEV